MFAFTAAMSLTLIFGSVRTPVHEYMLLPELQSGFLEQTAQIKWNSRWAEFQTCILTN